MAKGANPILSILNMQPKAPAAIPQPAEPTVAGPAQANLSSVPAPAMAPAPATPSTDLQISSTDSLDLPASLTGLMGENTPQVTINERVIQPFPMGTTAVNPQFPALDFRLQPTYAEGGMVGQGGMPVRPAGMNPQAQTQGNMSPQMIEMQIQEFMRTQPQAVAQIQQAIMAGYQTGELTPEEMNQGGQLAMTALQNPDMYPYLRRFAIQQGLATEQDLPADFDQGLVITIIIAFRAAQQMIGQMGMGGSMGSAPMVNPSELPQMRDGGIVTAGDHAAMGGKVKGAGTGTSDSIPIRVSAGEYVIPAHVVKAKGTEFFDKLLEAYSNKPKAA